MPRRAQALAAFGVLAVLAAVAAVLALKGPGDVFNDDVAFDAGGPAATAPRAPRGPDPFADGFSWPIYGYDKARTKYLPVSPPLRPPFVETWRATGRILLEFPPVLCGKQLFLFKNNAALHAISRRRGRVRWKRKLGYLAASSPACTRRTVFVVVLERGKGVRKGRVVAVDAANGRTRWSVRLPSRAESSPLLDGDRLYFGSEDGTVYSMRTRDGDIRWRHRVSGAVKGGLALADGKLFFGDYAGRVHAIRQTDGSRVWSASSAGATLRGRGNFYATPAVAFGRVYIGNTDGFVYSFSARDGRLAWRTKTGGFVYSSPAISPVRGGMVYAGSYDGRLYGFDARTGKVRWSRDSGGRISGGPQVVGDLVFYSNLARRSTGAVGAANGRPVWSTGRGAFNPVISDGRRIILVGYSSLFSLTTRAQARKDRRARTAQQRAEARRDALNRRVARRERAARRALERRVARRRALVRRVLDRRRRGERVCYGSGRRRVCRLPRPIVCFRLPDSPRTVCRARRGG